MPRETLERRVQRLETLYRLVVRMMEIIEEQTRDVQKPQMEDRIHEERDDDDSNLEAGIPIL